MRQLSEGLAHLEGWKGEGEMFVGGLGTELLSVTTVQHERSLLSPHLLPLLRKALAWTMPHRVQV